MEYIENYEEFFKLLKNYTNVFYKNMLTKYLNNPNYLEMLYVKGLFLLKNIFILLFFYCENINEVLLTSEKAYIYYIEFLIQINLNAMNLELTFRDAVLFTYKKTLLSYKKQNNTNTIKEKINKDLDTNLNILCNIFYLIDNRNFIEYNESITTSTNDYINTFVITKINNIKQLEKKVKHYLITNINLSELNNILLSLRDSVEKKIIINLNNKSNNKLTNKSNNKLNDKLNDKLNNKIYYLLDNYKANNLLTNITSFDE
jgi:hypothetical protein